jgi:hypothetical protein
VKASEIVRIALIAILAIVAIKLVAAKTNVPGLRSVAGLI